MTDISRRRFLAAAASTAMVAAAPRLSFGQATSPLALAVERRTIEVLGRAATVFGIRQPDGTQGIRLDAGERLRIALANRAGEETLIHWHGQTPPAAQDGVPHLSQEPLADGASWDYDYAPRPGTHWMHSHHGLQEQRLMAAPLIVREDKAADTQEVVVLLHDFSFADPAELLAGLQGTAHAMPMDHSGHMMVDHSAHLKQMAETSHASHGGAMPFGHANDIDYDAYLANDRTLADPELVKVDKGGRVRLRLINGATTTSFTIDTGRLKAKVLAVDGNPVLAGVEGTAFPLAMGQRLDLLVEIPRDGGAFPILALRETARERTGIILATPGAKVAKVAGKGQASSRLVDLSLEGRLAAVHALPERPTDRRYTVMLGQQGSAYVWTLNDQVHGSHTPLEVKRGERVEITFHNMSMMMHPMHLHGHHFQVVALGGKRVRGAVRDTVIVPAGMGMVTIAFDAANPGEWPLHCHNLFHMAAGMMTTVKYA
jgi:FtsP/CotA-like multicopper oxidase with cupredoxin domain